MSGIDFKKVQRTDPYMVIADLSCSEAMDELYRKKFVFFLAATSILCSQNGQSVGNMVVMDICHI